MRRSLVALGLLAIATPVAGRAQDPQIEPVLIELKLGRLASRTVPAHRAGDAALIPFIQFLEMAEIGRRSRDDGSVTAIFQPGNRELTVNPAGRTMRLDGAERPLAATEFIYQDGELFLATSVISQAADLAWDVRWQDLEVVVISPDNLPIGRRVRREELATARLAGGNPAGPPDGQLRSSHYPVEGLVADYSLLIPTNPGPKTGAYSGGIGLNVLGGSFEAQAQNEGSLENGKLRLDVSWTGVWRDNRWLSQLQLGDGYATGPRPRSVRGISLGNVPFRRPSLFGQLPFTGTLGPGWQLEAYRGGRLISFDSVNALGQFSIDVPIQYGENPVDFVAYGPFGEVRQFNQTYRVIADVVPAGRLEYGVSAGACRRLAPCQATANMDVRYGVTTRWTVFGGMEQFWRDSLPDLSHPYAGAILGLSNAVAIEAEAAADAAIRGQLRIEPSSDLQFFVEGTRFNRSVVEPILTPEGREYQLTMYGLIRPFQGRFGRAFYLDASYDQFRTATETYVTARVGASVQPGQFRFLPSVSRQTSGPREGARASRTLLGLNTIMLPLPQLGPVLGQVSARSNVEWQPSRGFNVLGGYLSYPLARNTRIEVGGNWFRGEKATLSVFLAADLRPIRAYTTVQRTPSGDILATQFLQGSVLYDGATQSVALAAGPSIQQAGVSGRVFLDLNGNGRFDQGEYVVPDVQVQVGIHSERSGPGGEYRIWPMAAFEPYRASVDSITLPSPLWTPAYRSIELVTRPNQFTTLDLPVVAGGIVEGSVSRATPTGDVPVPGATVVLTNRRTGRTMQVRSFNDGSFYLMGVGPGDWEATVDPAIVRGFGGQVVPLWFTIDQRLEGVSVAAVNLRIR